GAPSEIERLPDSIRVLTVVLRGSRHEKMVAVDARVGVAHQRVLVGKCRRRKAGAAARHLARADADRDLVGGRKLRREAAGAPNFEVELARATERCGGGIEIVAECGCREAAPRVTHGARSRSAGSRSTAPCARRGAARARRGATGA